MKDLRKKIEVEIDRFCIIGNVEKAMLVDLLLRHIERYVRFEVSRARNAVLEPITKTEPVLIGKAEPLGPSGVAQLARRAGRAQLARRSKRGVSADRE
jgi:hypothetical protein